MIFSGCTQPVKFMRYTGKLSYKTHAFNTGPSAAEYEAGGKNKKKKRKTAPSDQMTAPPAGKVPRLDAPANTNTPQRSQQNQPNNNQNRFQQQSTSVKNPGSTSDVSSGVGRFAQGFSSTTENVR